VRDVWIRNRPDGVTEFSPQRAPFARDERWLLVFSAVMAICGFFVAGVMPAPVLAVLVACCLAGEVILAARSLVLVLRRPLAEVHEVPSWRPDRRAR
jgi:hypothetical protein